MPITSAKSVRAVPLGEQAREALLSAIVGGELRPGEALREETLATALGISRTPVREALHRLTEIDLVRVESSRGYRVTPLEAERLTEIVQVAAELAGMAARLALPRLTPEDMAWFDQVEGHVLAVDQPLSGTYPYGPYAIDLFVERCGNSVLRDVIGNYRPHLIRLLRMYGTSVTRRTMAGRAAGVVSALRSGDAHLVDDALRAYYTLAGNELVAAHERAALDERARLTP